MDMSLEEKKKLGRKKRGEIDESDLEDYLEFSKFQLIEMLKSNEAQKRTIAATILGKNQVNEAVEPLCQLLLVENALYSRIAISEALGNIGEAAVLPVSALLGKIGNNQEEDLPTKYFNKKSYPLVRDLAGRTLVKIGKPATTHLIELLCAEEDIFVKQQVIDTLGGITAKTGDFCALKPFIILFDACVNNPRNMDKITLWKIIRALSAFKGSKEAAHKLLFALKIFSEPPLLWESARSLGQIQVKSLEIINSLELLSLNENKEIKKAAKNALMYIN